MSNTSLLGSFGGQAGDALIFRNLLINGNCTIDQRNAGANQTITAAAAYAYTVDRWYAYSSGGNPVGARVAASGAYQFTGAAGVTEIGFAQRIEAANCRHLAGGTATLSVDLSNSLLTTVTWTAFYANTNDAFGTRAALTRTQIATGTFTVSSTLSRYSVSFAVPSAATTGIEIVFSVGAQTSGTWRIDNAMLEAGPTATPFERRPLSLEVQLAQRYFQVVNAPQYLIQCDANQFYIYTASPVKLRASPSTVKWLTAAYLHRSGEVSPVTINTVANTTISPNPGYDNFDFSIGHTIVFDSIYTFAAGQYVLNQSPTAGNLYSAQVYISVESEL